MSRPMVLTSGTMTSRHLARFYPESNASLVWRQPKGGYYLSKTWKQVTLPLCGPPKSGHGLASKKQSSPRLGESLGKSRKFTRDALAHSERGFNAGSRLVVKLVGCQPPGTRAQSRSVRRGRQITRDLVLRWFWPAGHMPLSS